MKRSEIFNCFIPRKRDSKLTIRLESTSALETPRVNPLCDTYNLEIIFDYLGVEDLKVCRLVNKTWCSEATKYLRQRSIIFIDNPLKLQMYSNMTSHDLSITTSTNIHLKTNFYHPEKTEHHEKNDVNWLIDFFEKYGNRIKILHIFIDLSSCRQDYTGIPSAIHFTHLQNVQKLIVHLQSNPIGHPLPEMPSVRELQIIHYKSRMINRGPPIPEYFEELYALLPNLRKVTGIPLERLTSENIPSAGLCELEEPINLFKDDLQKLIAKKFPLKKLSVTMDSWSQELPESIFMQFDDFLKTVGGTLREFTVNNIPFEYFENWYGNALKNLKILTINTTIKSLDFVIGFPNLKILKVVCLDSIGPDTYKYKLESSHPTLKTLEINCPCSPIPSDLMDEFAMINNAIETWDFHKIKEAHTMEPCHSYMSDACIRNLAKSFPNLTTLKLSHLADEEVRVIYEELPKLKELVLKAGRITDYGITEIAKEIQCSIDLNETSVSLHEPRHVCLRNLKELTKIELHCENLTDSCFLNGLLECKHLTKVTIIGSTVAADRVESLVTQLDLLHLEIYLPPKSKSSTVLKFSQARRILNKMRGRTLNMSECIAPSRELTNKKIRKYIEVIKIKQKIFGHIQWPCAIRAYTHYPERSPTVRTDANPGQFTFDWMDHNRPPLRRHLIHGIVFGSCGLN